MQSRLREIHMVNYIWGGMIVISIIFGMLNGTLSEVNAAIFQGAEEAVKIVIGLVGVLTFWLGFMAVAQAAGLLDQLANVFRPIVAWIFPDVPKHSKAMGYMVANMVANIFGLGNAATPLGLKAMHELQMLNEKHDEASRSMITFLVINTAGVTLIPTTIIGLRTTYHSANPSEIILSTICASLTATIGAIFIDRYFYYRRRCKKK